MPYPVPLLTVDQLRARIVMPAADLRRLQGIQWKKPTPDTAAGIPVPETTIGVWDDAGVLEQVLFVPASALAADPTNNATLTVFDRTGGGSPVTLAQLATDSLSWSQGVPVVVPILESAIASGDALSVEIAQAASGVAVPAGELFLVITPNFVTTTIDDHTDKTISRLVKRYPAPTAANPWPDPVANLIMRWVTKMVARDLFAKRGWSPQSESDRDDIEKAADTAEAELKEAADGQNGLLELALADDGNSSVTAPTPLSYSEQSPYTASRRQRWQGRNEDENTPSGSGGA
jgi:hypothetical protein